MPDPRMSHHHPQPPHSYPSHPGYPPAPSHSSHPSYHHHSSRHSANGPPPPALLGPPPGMPAGGPESGVVPAPMGNGHSHAPPPMTNGTSPAVRRAREDMDKLLGALATANENTWMLIADQMNDTDRAVAAWENALRHNPTSILGLNAIATHARSRDNFDKAIEYFQRILNIKQDNGEAWGSMGHCLLMKDDLPKAYTAYQQALYHLPNPKEPKLWYGIGILYDRYGSFEHAEEAFTSVLKMDPNFEKANEIYFRLGIIYKHQRKYTQSLECFRYILNNPPRPLTSWDIWFQLGHVYEQDRDFDNAKEAYMRVLSHQPDHAKVLQQLGWLFHQPGASFADQDKAVQYLTKSLETDGNDAQSWYLLGRAFMAGQRYNKAYEAYQQAVYRDGRNPTFWCSIGVLYYQINQYRDALDAYSRAIRLNPYISEVWYNLGSLYESCNNQITDAIDAYSRAAELDPGNTTIKQRLQMLQASTSSNAPLPPAPGPVDVHPSQYSATPSGPYVPGQSPAGSPRAPPGQLQEGPAPGRDLPPPPPGDFRGNHSPGPFRGGAVPPPLANVDDSRGAMSRHAPLAPMEMERREDGGLRDPREREMPVKGRYEAAPPDHRRLIHSPGSPKRREAFPAYPGYSQAGYRDREREEWDRRERERRQGPPAPIDPRGPSPRMNDRAPAPPFADPRSQPSPRVPPPDHREYGRHGEGSYPYYAHERGYPPGPDPRDRYDIRRGYDDHEPPKPDATNGRHPSVSRDFRPDDPRAPSPALSTTSKAGSKRGRESDGKMPSAGAGAKKQREEKAGGRKSGGGPGGGVGEKEKKSRSPRGDEGSSPAVSTGSGHRTPMQVAPTRTVDEDYDEGAADALIALHEDRQNGSISSAATGPSPRGQNVTDLTSPLMGMKRTDPPSPTSPRSPTKKSKSGDSAGSGISIGASGGSKPSPTHGRSRTVIEVLNTPRITSPLPLLEGVRRASLDKEKEKKEKEMVEVEKEVEIGKETRPVQSMGATDSVQGDMEERNPGMAVEGEARKDEEMEDEDGTRGTAEQAAKEGPKGEEAMEGNVSMGEAGQKGGLLLADAAGLGAMRSETIKGTGGVEVSAPQTTDGDVAMGEPEAPLAFPVRGVTAAAEAV